MKNATDIVGAIYASYEKQFNAEPFRPHLGASMGADPCLRKLWYSFRHAKKVNFEGRMLKLFQRGHKEEYVFVDDLNRAGIRVINETLEGEQFRLVCAQNKHVSGSTDGFAEVLTDAHPSLTMGTTLVCEMKTHGENSFKKLKKENVKNSKPLHYGQMQIYIKWTRDTWGADITQALYVAVNKNTDELYIEVIQYDPTYAQQIENNMIHVVESESIPKKLHTDPSRFECKYCDYSDVCHTDTFKLEVNCRTCIFSKPMADGTWYCKHKDTTIDTTKPCESHVFHQHLLDGFEFREELANDNYLSYLTKQGEVFENGFGENSFNSTQLAQKIADGEFA